MRVYLAGTINTEAWTRRWRVELARRIQAAGHTPLNPMRYQTQETFTRDGLGDSSTPSSFFWKVDMGDLARADVVVVYYRQALGSGYRRQSCGTWGELAIAAWERKPIIVITDDPDVRDHPMIQQSAAIVVSGLDEAWEWLQKILVTDVTSASEPA